MTDRRVLFFGDSLIAGVGDPEGRGWVGRIVAASFQMGRPLTPYNLGVRRQTSVEIAARWRAEAAPRLAAEAACKVVFSFGANDTTIEDGRLRVEPEESLAALATVINQTAAVKVPTLIVGPAPVDDEQHTERIAALSTRMEALCDECGVPFLGIVDELRGSEVWQEELRTGDGAHPATEGYSLLAELLLGRGLCEWLAAAETSRTPGGGSERTSNTVKA